MAAEVSSPVALAAEASPLAALAAADRAHPSHRCHTTHTMTGTRQRACFPRASSGSASAGPASTGTRRPTAPRSSSAGPDSPPPAVRARCARPQRGNTTGPHAPSWLAKRASFRRARKARQPLWFNGGGATRRALGRPGLCGFRRGGCAALRSAPGRSRAEGGSSTSVRMHAHADMCDPDPKDP